MINNILWLDLLSPSSYLKLYYLSKKHKINKIYYCNTYKSPFLSLLTRIFPTPERTHFNSFIEADERYNGTSYYELIQENINSSISKIFNDENTFEHIEKTNQGEKIDPEIFQAHLMHSSFNLLYRPVELLTIAKHVKKEDNNFFLFKKTPFLKHLRSIFKSNSIFQYQMIFLKTSSIKLRRNYYFDKHILKHYYHPIFNSYKKILYSFISFTSLFLFSIFRRNKEDSGTANIGVDMVRSRVGLNEVNDIYWLKGSDINPGSIYTFEYEYYDKASSSVLDSLGINRQLLALSPMLILKHIKNKHKNWNLKVAQLEKSFIRKILPNLSDLAKSLLTSGFSRLILLEKIYFSYSVGFFESLYRANNIKIHWSMFDDEAHKFIKAQALNNNKGLSCGSHWSNYPMYTSDIKRGYDVLFSWGNHFQEIFKTDNIKKILSLGYPLDFYFNHYTTFAKEFREKHPGKFIVSYHDNVTAHDLPYSPKAQLDIHNMLIDLLDKHPNMLLVLKPKRYLQNISFYDAIPRINELRSNGRIIILYDENSREKFVPAKIGLASDLVIGLGISTSSTECALAGSKSIHADFTNFKKNKFASKNKDKIIFNDIKSLKDFVDNTLESKKALDHEPNDYLEVDPFQDGKTYLRTGEKLKKIQSLYNDGLDKNEIIEKL